MTTPPNPQPELMNDHINPLISDMLCDFAAMVRSPIPSHICPKCGTQYYAPGECDWCVDVRLVEVVKKEETK